MQISWRSVNPLTPNKSSIPQTDFLDTRRRNIFSRPVVILHDDTTSSNRPTTTAIHFGSRLDLPVSRQSPHLSTVTMSSSPGHRCESTLQQLRCKSTSESRQHPLALNPFMLQWHLLTIYSCAVYVKGKHLSYQRGKRNTYPNTSLLKLEGVDDQKAATYVLSS